MACESHGRARNVDWLVTGSLGKAAISHWTEFPGASW